MWGWRWGEVGVNLTFTADTTASVMNPDKKMKKMVKIFLTKPTHPIKEGKFFYYISACIVLILIYIDKVSHTNSHHIIRLDQTALLCTVTASYKL